MAYIECGTQDCLFLGNLDAKRDWGHARDYAKGMWRMLQEPAPDDYVLSTGQTHSVREFVELAFSQVNRQIVWSGRNIEETGRERRTGNVLVRIDPAYFRPTEVDLLIGDPRKAREKLGWLSRTAFPELVEEMVSADLQLAALEKSGGKAEVQKVLRDLVFDGAPRPAQ